MAEYIDREALAMRVLGLTIVDPMVASYADAVLFQIQQVPAADVVEVKTLKEWLYAIAMNNVGAPIEDMASACEEIANRLDGLRAFAREEQ